MKTKANYSSLKLISDFYHIAGVIIIGIGIIVGGMVATQAGLLAIGIGIGIAVIGILVLGAAQMIRLFINLEQYVYEISQTLSGKKDNIDYQENESNTTPDSIRKFSPDEPIHLF